MVQANIDSKQNFDGTQSALDNNMCVISPLEGWLMADINVERSSILRTTHKMLWLSGPTKPPGPTSASSARMEVL